MPSPPLPTLTLHRPSDPETRSMILVDNVVSFFLLAAGGLRVALCCCVFSSGAATATALSLASGRIASVAVVFAALRILSFETICTTYEHGQRSILGKGTRLRLVVTTACCVNKVVGKRKNTLVSE